MQPSLKKNEHGQHRGDSEQLPMPVPVHAGEDDIEDAEHQQNVREDDREDEFDENSAPDRLASIRGVPGAFHISNPSSQRESETSDGGSAADDDDDNIPHASVVDDEFLEEEADQLRVEVTRIHNENAALRTSAMPVDAVTVAVDKEQIRTKKICIIYAAVVLLLLAIIAVVVLVTTLTSTSAADPGNVPTLVPTKDPTTSSPTLPPIPTSSSPSPDLPRWSQLGQDLLGKQVEEEFAYVDLNANGDVLAVGGIYGRDNAGVVRVYQYRNISLLESNNSFASSDWTQLGHDVVGPPPQNVLGSKFGGRLSLSKDGMVMATSAPFLNENAGSVFIYYYSPEDNEWMPHGNVSDRVGVVSEPETQTLGIAISLSGDGTTLAVAEMSFARVYNLRNGIWEKVGQDVLGEPTRDIDLSEDGRTLAVRFGSTSYTRVYSLDENDEKWVQLGNDIETDASFGFVSTDLSADGKTIAIADPKNDDVASNAGSVTVHRLDSSSGNWIRLGPAVGSPNLLQGDSKDDQFGSCVSISADGNRIAAGARESVDEPGLVRVLDWTGEEWIRVSLDIIGNEGEGAGFYCSMAGSRMALGFPSFNTNTGFARVMELQELKST